MWKKDEAQPVHSSPAHGGGSAPASTPAPSRTGVATIGPSIVIKGDVTGSEDLLIHGRVDGSVTLEKHAVGVGSEGRVKADISGRIITIEGHVEGDLSASEQIVLRGSAQVHGDIKAPRVVLEDGATFRGLVDMGASAAGKANRTDGGSTTKAAQAEGSNRTTKADGPGVAQATA